MSEMEVGGLCKKELGHLCIISRSVCGGPLWAAEPARLVAERSGRQRPSAALPGVSAAAGGLHGAVGQRAPSSHGDLSCFIFAFVAGLLLCSMSQTSALIKSNEFWSAVSDLDQAEARTESSMASLCFPGSVHPGPALAMLRTGQCCEADYFLLIFAF